MPKSMHDNESAQAGITTDKIDLRLSRVRTARQTRTLCRAKTRIARRAPQPGCAMDKVMHGSVNKANTPPNRRPSLRTSRTIIVDINKKIAARASELTLAQTLVRRQTEPVGVHNFNMV